MKLCNPSREGSPGKVFTTKLQLADESRCTIAAMTGYRVDVRKSDEGYSVSCPELPGCWSQGATEEEALANIEIAIEEYVDAANELGL
jgi:predicted RNase H-like HicB family nuclease